MEWMRNHYPIMIVFIVIAMMLIVPLSTSKAWTYTVRNGDSLWKIASRTGNTVDNIKNSSGVWGDKISPGQRIAMPTGASHGISKTDRELLARLVAAEAEGEPYQGKVAVVAVILNRVKDSRFPDTIRGVVYQRHAFESVSNGLIWRRSPENTVYKAVDDALKGWDPSYRSVFFWNPYKPVSSWIWSRPVVVQYGNHVFAK